MALKDPASDICTALLSGQTLSGVVLTAGTNLYTSGRQENPGSKPAVYLLNVGGSAPLVLLGGNRQSLYTPSVQVMIEGIEDNFAQAESLARAVYDALEQAPVSGYVGVYCRDSQPVYLGMNLWVINVDAPWAP